MSAVTEVARALHEGRPALIPTDTVYGLAADARNAAAVRRLFELKGRPDDKPIPLLAGSVDEARACASAWPEAAERLAAAFWPGALTIVVDAAGWVPEEVTRGTGAVGVRVPGHELAFELLREFGGALACTSANRSGEAPIADLRRAPAEFFAADVSRLDGGLLEPRAASTVVRVADKKPLEVLREGPIGVEALRTAVGASPETGV